MDECATEIMHQVTIPEKKGNSAKIDWMELLVPKKIGGKMIYTCPAIPAPAGVNPCDLNQVFSDRFEWENLPVNEGYAPFACGPKYQATERITRFGSRITKTDFNALLRILGLKRDRNADEKWQEWHDKGYLVVYHEALHPKTAGYLTQMRIISECILQKKFRTPEAISSMPRQPVAMDEVLWLFIKQEKKNWDKRNGDKSLAGVFADSHNWDTSLRFGIMKEDAHGSVVRIFSDASLRFIDYSGEE